MSGDVDAILIGAGHNALVAANLLAEQGWSVLVLEEQNEPGGAVRSGEITEPGFTSDLFSSFYPLAVASPVIRSLDLERHGLTWCRSPLAVAHPQADGGCAVISLDLDETASSLESFGAGDGQAWRDLYAYWEQVGGPFIDALLRPFPPIRGAARLLTAFGPSGLLRVRAILGAAGAAARRRALPRRRWRWLLGGNALHADLTPESAGGGLFGWVLCGLGQQYGFPERRAARAVDQGARRPPGIARRAARMRRPRHARDRAKRPRRRRAHRRRRGRSRRGALSWPEPLRRRCSVTWSAKSTSRGDSSTACAHSSSTTPRSKSIGRSTRRSHGRPPMRGEREPCMSPTTWMRSHVPAPSSHAA